MSFEKENFLRTRLVSYFQQLAPSTPPRWGKMSVQQMIEHFGGDAVRNANGRLKFDRIVTAPERLEKIREFMMRIFLRLFGSKSDRWLYDYSIDW